MPSRDNAPRGGATVSPPADREARPAAEATPPPPPAAARPARPSQPPAGRDGLASRRALKNWRVRSRLLLLITIPTLTAVVLGGTRIVSSVQSALTFQRIEQLAKLSSAVTTLAGKLEDERDQTVLYIAQAQTSTKAAAPQLQQVRQQYALTAPWIAQVRSQLGAIGGTFPDQVQEAKAKITTALAGLPRLRQLAMSVGAAPGVISGYSASIDHLFDVDDDIALGSGDPQLASSVRALGVISRIEEQTSEQRAALGYALTRQTFEPGVLAGLTTAHGEMSANIPEFQDAATPQQAALYNKTVSGAQVAQADSDENRAINAGSGSQGGVKSLQFLGVSPQQWMTEVSVKIGDMRQVDRAIVAAAVSRASQLRRNAIIESIIIGAAVTIVLGLALVLTSLVGRSMVRPLRRLRAGALEIAGLQLPETVRRMSESDGPGGPLSVEPIDVDSADEIGEVARAFDQVHREALRLAANEAALRGNVNAMFVNLSRRSQSLVERQIRLIDDLEQGEQDAERLGSLFQMDHLATRMRRNSENLLVLAGHDSSRRWNQPVALVDVLRAAVSEIEQYERVSLNVQPGISVRGHAVNDAVHLLAELAENATSFSSAETPVTISGHLLSSGGVLLDITDQGVGMGAEEMAHANWRLDNPPVVDVAVSRRMGLFVVARLAARHGIRVRLRPAASGGLTALVWLPDEVVSRDGVSPSGQLPDGLDDPVSVTMPGTAAFGGGLAAFGGDAGDRAATAQEVSAARTPKFASLQTGGTENGGSSLGPRRVPGAGPRPGADAWPPGSTTGPIPAVPGSPQLTGDAAAEPAAAESFASGPFAGPAQVAADTGPWPVSPSVTQEAAPAAPGDAGAGGNGPKLPKRRVDRDEPDGSPAAGNLFAAGSTDMFSTGSPGSPGSEGSGDMFGGASGWGTGPADAFGTGPLTSPSPAPPAGPPAAPPVAAAPDAGAGEPSQPAELAGAGPEPQAVFSAPVSAPPSVAGANNGTANGSNGFSWDPGPAGDEVVIPPADLTTEYRLPIFEAVESDWFRRGRSSVGWAPQEELSDANGSPAALPQAEPAASTWTSPADEGWQAAAAAAEPTAGGVTTAGLPKRVPRANLVPGTAGAEPAAAAPARSASATRDRLASFQRGVREGRAAAGTDSSNREDGSSS